jgi:SAM-dependent methyltransferase
MSKQTEDTVQAHWTKPGLLGRIETALKEMGRDPERLSPEILATVEHLHSGGLATTRDQAELLSLTPESRVLDVGCGTGGPARFLADKYGCRVDGIDLTPEFVEVGQELTRRCGLSDRVSLRVGNALDLPYANQRFDVVWCQNVTMNISDKARFLAGVHRVLKPGGLFTSTEFSTGSGGDLIYPVPWAYDASISFLDPEDVMRAQLEDAGFKIRDWINYTDTVIQGLSKQASATDKLTNRLALGDDTQERQRNAQRNLSEGRLVYWMICATATSP